MHPNSRNDSPIRLGLLALTAALTTLLSACSGFPSVSGDKVFGLVRPYRMDIVQGNVLTKEQVAKVKPGMSRAQVRDLLGTSLLTDVFHEDRWDYVFTIRRQGIEPQQRLVVAWFDGDLLKQLDLPPDLPSENEFVSAINTRELRGDAPKLALTEEERKALPVPAKPPTPAAETIGVQRSFPPLEAQK
ncbi:outer membrane protein assembly factor BamE [Paucibacter sp. B2R-40]|uniref:outer membrane protein assembly factor BamE n=1 Tax=Paucibacter sp. B2R-40 TaxID=2893554 RepID=UPI0021E42DA2|nr:outer membrane protein assembly factor BamE [Paucibacter sp. B2R-40]MCV2353590.1 outer membrane protein assembly factor BamE [Paucibacter sp. B2R-40]